MGALHLHRTSSLSRSPASSRSAAATLLGSKTRSHAQATDGPGEEEADLGARPRRGGERRGPQDKLQPTLALHPGEGPQCGHQARLLLRPGAHGARPPGGQMDQDAAALLRDRP